MVIGIGLAIVVGGWFLLAAVVGEGWAWGISIAALVIWMGWSGGQECDEDISETNSGKFNNGFGKKGGERALRRTAAVQNFSEVPARSKRGIDMRAYIKATGLAVALMASPDPAFAGNYTLAVTPSAVQTIRYDRGIASIDSVQQHSIVRFVNVAGNDKKTVSFVIGIVNARAQPLNFGPENVTIRPAGMQPIALTTYEQAMEAERKKQGREKFWAGVAAFGRGLSAADAGNTYTSGIYGGTTSGYVGNNLVTAQTNGIYSGTQYNSGAALAAQHNAREMNAEDRANLEARWAARWSVNSNLLRTTTVDPGAMYGGIATFPIGGDLKKARGPVQVTVEVDVGGEKHVFFARLTEAD